MATLTSPTLDRLIKEVRVYLNQTDSTNSFWKDEELTIYLNDAVRMYFIELVQRAEGQFDKQVNLDITSGVETIALPSDCFEIKALYKKYDANAYKILPYRNNLNESWDTLTGNGGNSYEPYYYLRGNSIVLRPPPQFSETGTMYLEYIGFPDTMIWGGDSLTSNVSPIFKELIVMYAVYKAKIKEDLVNGGSTSAAAASHLADLYKNFKENVGLRSKYPQSVRPWLP